MTKKYKVLFFSTIIGNTGTPLRDALPNPLVTGLSVPAQLAAHSIEGIEYQVRDFTKIGTSQVWKGVFGKLRDDAPHVVNAAGQESSLSLLATDRLLEKCHFLYFASHDILVWQVNNEVAYVGKFTIYLGLLLNTYVAANAVVGTSALQRVIQGSVKTIECKVATPRVPLSNIPNYSQPMFDLMNDVQGSSIKINISAGRSSLSANVKRLIQWASGNPDTKSLKVKLDGESEPIDLLVNRISGSINVNLIGHYPDPVDVFNGLDTAFTDNRDELTPYFR
jgi:hypothetical protein